MVKIKNIVRCFRGQAIHCFVDTLLGDSIDAPSSVTKI